MPRGFGVSERGPARNNTMKAGRLRMRAGVVRGPPGNGCGGRCGVTKNERAGQARRAGVRYERRLA